MGLFDDAAGVLAFAAGSTDEAVGRQFDDEPGGGVWEPDRAESGPTAGSNRWVSGTIETLQNPVDRLTNPYDTVAGAADAAALRFDEGVGGLYSLVDDEPGNTAGPGQRSIWDTEGSGPVREVASKLVLVVVVLFGLKIVLEAFVSGAAEGLTS